MPNRANTVPKLLIYFSNPQIFESSLLDALESLSGRVEMTIILQSLQQGSNLEARLEELSKSPLVSGYRTIVQNSSRKVSPFQPGAITQLMWELAFWTRHVKWFRSQRYDVVIIHSETLLSDFVAAEMALSPKNVLVLHPNRPFSEMDMKLDARLTSRLRTLFKTLSRIGLQSFLRQLNFGLQAGIYRPLVKPIFRSLLGKSMSEMKIARWWIDGRNFGCYVIEPGRKLKREIDKEAPIFTVDYKFAPEHPIPSSPQSTSGLLLIGGPDAGWLPNEVRSVCSDVFYLSKFFNLSSIVIRPHPRYRSQATDFDLELRRLNLQTSVSLNGRSLKDDVIESRVVFGTNSSALHDCLTWVMDRPVIGITVDRKNLSNFQRLNSDRLIWLDSELRDSTTLTKALRNQFNLTTSAPQTKLSDFIESFVWSASTT